MENLLMFFEYEITEKINTDKFNNIIKKLDLILEDEYLFFISKNIKNIYLKEDVELDGNNLLKFDFLYDKENLLTEGINYIYI